MEELELKKRGGLSARSTECVILLPRDVDRSNETLCVTFNLTIGRFSSVGICRKETKLLSNWMTAVQSDNLQLKLLSTRSSDGSIIVVSSTDIDALITTALGVLIVRASFLKTRRRIHGCNAPFHEPNKLVTASGFGHFENDYLCSVCLVLLITSLSKCDTVSSSAGDDPSFRVGGIDIQEIVGKLLLWRHRLPRRLGVGSECKKAAYE